MIVVRGRWSAGLAWIYRASDRSKSERYRDLVQRSVSRAWPPAINPIRDLRGEIEIAIFYGMARLAKDVRLAPGRAVTPDFAVHARRLLAALGHPHKIYDGEPCPLSQEPAAKDGLRAHDRHLIAAFRSAHCHC